MADEPAPIVPRPPSAAEGALHRLRVTYAKGGALQWIGHLDTARMWERAFRRARLPLAHSQGFNPRPRYQLAAALPVGVSGRAELLDLWLSEPLPPGEVLARLRSTTPPGLEALEACEVEPAAPALQAQMRAADYTAVVCSLEPVEAIGARIQRLLAAPSLPRRRQHKGEWQSYDLRPLILELGVAPDPAEEGQAIVAMRLTASPQGAGRPDEVLDALGLRLAVRRMERTRLHFEGAHDA